MQTRWLASITSGGFEYRQVLQKTTFTPDDAFAQNLVKNVKSWAFGKLSSKPSVIIKHR